MADTLTNVLRKQSDADRPRPGPSAAVGVGRPLATRSMSPTRSVVGFVLMDSTLNPIFINAEAKQILNYPDRCAKGTKSRVITDPGGDAVTKIRSDLTTQFSSELPFVTEFRSGRRQYYCRAFVVDSNGKDRSGSKVAVLLERGPSSLTSLSQVSLRFNLTPREEEALKHLLHGLTSKEIASRMSISPNTVKAFLRLIMTKMGVSSRSAIVLKTLMIRPQ